MSGRTGWFAAAGSRVGNPEAGYETVYSWDGLTFPTQQLAIDHGFTLDRSDDFNVGSLVDGRLAWWGWMHDQHPPEDRASVAKALCLVVAS